MIHCQAIVLNSTGLDCMTVFILQYQDKTWKENREKKLGLAVKAVLLDLKYVRGKIVQKSKHYLFHKIAHTAI